MEVPVLIELISTFGFPIACAVALGWFAFYLISKTNTQNEANMAAVQARCKEREDKLYQEIKENREINAKAIETITMYAERLDTIQQDVKDIKTIVTVNVAKS